MKSIEKINKTITENKEIEIIEKNAISIGCRATNKKLSLIYNNQQVNCFYVLKSYNTRIALYDFHNKTLFIDYTYYDYSPTTLKHYRAFLDFCNITSYTNYSKNNPEGFDSDKKAIYLSDETFQKLANEYLYTNVAIEYNKAYKDTTTQYNKEYNILNILSSYSTKTTDYSTELINALESETNDKIKTHLEINELKTRYKKILHCNINNIKFDIIKTCSNSHKHISTKIKLSDRTISVLFDPYKKFDIKEGL